MRLMAITYDGITREVEPYSLAYKRRQDGHAEEYFYVWDRTGGNRSGAGIKAFVNTKIQDIRLLEEKFEPRFTVELSKAGEAIGSGYFAGHSFGGRRSEMGGSQVKRPYHGMIYTLECQYCGKRFKRREHTTRLNEHKDKYGNRCYGRVGYIVDQTYSGY
jgi:hypothetical protein